MVFVIILTVGASLANSGCVMSWQAKKYRGYATECVRLAKQADSIEKRNKLLELARVWMDAALVEEQFATDAMPLSPRVA
jgi:hypothetical protein